jgi:hypothetical protein
LNGDLDIDLPIGEPGRELHGLGFDLTTDIGIQCERIPAYFHEHA